MNDKLTPDEESALQAPHELTDQEASQISGGVPAPGHGATPPEDPNAPQQ